MQGFAVAGRGQQGLYSVLLMAIGLSACSSSNHPLRSQYDSNQRMETQSETPVFIPLAEYLQQPDQHIPEGQYIIAPPHPPVRSSAQSTSAALQPESAKPREPRVVINERNQAGRINDAEAASPELSPVSGLQLTDAVRQALASHPSIDESLGRLFQQNEQVSVARAGYYPQVSSGISNGYRSSTGRSEEAFTLSASQLIYDFGKVSSSVDAANHGVRRDQAAVLVAVDELLRDTSHAFIDVQRYQTLLGIVAQQIVAIADLEELAAQRAARGASSLSDEIQARSRKEAAQAMEWQMKAQLDVSKRTLQNLLSADLPPSVSREFPGTLESACQRVAENVDDAPHIQMAEAERAEARAVIQQARAEFLPSLSLNADYEHYFNRGRSDPNVAGEDNGVVVRLNLSSNLFQGGATSARKRAADHALYSATAARDSAHLALSRNLREAKDQTDSLDFSLAVQDARHASLVRTQELYRHQYLALGTRTLLDILNTEQEIFQTRMDKQNTLFDLRTLQVNCLFSVGGLRRAFMLDELIPQAARLQP